MVLIYYPKKIPRPDSRAVKVNFSTFSGCINITADEHLLPQKYAKMAYNFSGASGALKKCFGIEEFMPASFRALRCFFYRRYDKAAQKHDNKFIFLGTDLCLYYLDGETPVKIENTQFTSVPVAINYRLNDEDVIIFSSETDDMTVWDGANAPVKIANAPKITSMCVHYERLFATIDGEKSSLWFSADLDPTNWNVSIDEAGFIEMADERGQLLKVMSFLDYVYVFRGNGIAKVTAYGDQTQFNVSQLYTGTGRIYDGSAVICGDRVIFLAEDGLYVFDGISTYRILDNIRAMFKPNNENAVAEYLNGKYYLACNLDFDDEAKDNTAALQNSASRTSAAIQSFASGETATGNNAVIEYDISTRDFCVLRGADVKYMTAARGENFSRLILCLADGRVGEMTSKGGLFGKLLKKSWLTPVSDFGYPDHQKRLKEIFLLTREDITLRVTTDGTAHEYRISGGGKISSKKLGLTGTLVGLEFISETADPYISKPMLKAEVL